LKSVNQLYATVGLRCRLKQATILQKI